ncbi:MAG: DegT/DnrJ/EryC1/StrS family aminotransferase [Parachlamydiaceae bacterium]
MKNQHFLPYAKQSISADDIEAVKHALSQPAITRGPLVVEFENAVAAYCEAQYAVAFNSATAALMAAYHAAETGPNDTVVTTPNSFVASVGPAIQHHATPVFIDIDRNTGNLDATQLLLNVNREHSKGKTIITPVHFAGIPVDMQKIDASITDYRTIVIEDAAHAIGSCYKDGSKVGNCRWSHMTVFSFHPAKTMTTGEGGMVTTNDKELYHKLQLYRNNGIENDPLYLKREDRPGYYEVNFLSGNYNVTEMQAALGISQLKRLDQFVAKRQLLMDRYREKLSSIENLRLLTPDQDLTVAYHLCVAQINFKAYKTTKKNVMEKLKEQNIGTQVHYIPLYQHPFFTSKNGNIAEYFPEMENYYAEALSLPLYYDLTEEDVDHVAMTLKNILMNSRG